MVPHWAVGREVIVRVRDGILRVFDGPELLVSYPVHEGRGHLVAHPHLVEALKNDREQIRMKYRKPLHRSKGAARTIGLFDELAWQVMVPKRDLSEYAVLLGGGGAHD